MYGSKTTIRLVFIQSHKKTRSCILDEKVNYYFIHKEAARLKYSVYFYARSCETCFKSIIVGW
ncbi:Uncharacterized protein OBRU01_09614, partial [Operophtera brumata]